MSKQPEAQNTSAEQTAPVSEGVAPVRSDVRNPKLWLDPDTARFQQLYKYTSIDETRLAQTVRNYKGSLKYIGGLLAGCIVLKMFTDGAVKEHIFGENGNGGSVLTMYTRNSQHDYSYNRHFQRARYLNEEPTGDDPFAMTQKALLADLGFPQTQNGHNGDVIKRAPHFKYF